MCVSDPARVIDVSPNGGEAVVELRGARRRLSVALLALEGQPVQPGEWVLASAGMAVERLDEAAARALLELMEQARTEEDAT